MAAHEPTQMDTYFQNFVQSTRSSSTNNEASIISRGMNFELCRLASFKEWPRWSPVQPNRLARSGFYFTGQNDETVCFSCGCRVQKWHEGDMPDNRHRRVNANCPLMTGRQTDNVPLPRPEQSDAIPNAGSIQPNALQSPNVGTVQSYERSDHHAATAHPPEYQDERRRLESFRNWPADSWLGPEELAQAGFIYLGSTDRVQCVFCRGILRNWTPGDRAFSEHQKHFPHCPFVRNPEIGQRRSPPSEPRATTQHSSVGPHNSTLSALGIVTDRPKHAGLAVKSRRVATFSNWPSERRQMAEDLAEAGFFSAGGQGDSVKCYWCDGGLRSWQPNDDPWVEHAKYFPNCGHLKRNKDKKFIDVIQQSRQHQPQSVISQHGHVLRDVGPREISSRLDMPIVKNVIDMGFDKTFVQKLIEYKLRTSGDDFVSSTDLLNACLQFKETPPSDFPLPSIEASTGVAQQQLPDAEDIPQKRRKKDETAMETGGNSMECKVCMDRNVSVVFLPCGHLVCCTECALALVKCPICRADIKGTVNAFIA